VIGEYQNSTLKRRYVYGTYIDEPLASLASSGTLYYHQTRVYSVVALSNGAGQLAERYGYTPYGKRRVVSPSGQTLAASVLGNQVGFTGRYHDSETGLTYFRARYQDAELGRFAGRDPIGLGDYLIFRFLQFSKALPRPQSHGIVVIAHYPAAFVPNALDPSGEDVWIEGPSSGEPGGHLSVAIGDPNGNYKAYSYGAESPLAFEPPAGVKGAVYEDTKPGGAIIPGSYMKTSPEEDQQTLWNLQHLVGGGNPFASGNGECYTFGNTCRDFSGQVWNAVRSSGVGQLAPPPATLRNNSTSAEVPWVVSSCQK